jgi:hypothetical protein
VTIIFRRLASLIALATGMCDPRLARAEKGDESSTPKKTQSSYSPGFSVVPIPVVNYAPETGLLLGLAGAFFIRPEDPKLRPTDWVSFVAYSTKGLALGVFDMDGYGFEDRFYLGANVQVARYPNRFYGVGNDTRLEDEELYTFDGFQLTWMPMGRVANHLYLGGLVALDLNDLRKAEPGGLLETGAVLGASGGRSVGIGAAAKYDTRDNTVNPTRGEHVLGTATVYHAALGSQFDYESAQLDLRKFFPVGFGHVFAAQVLLRAQRGAPPYFGLNQLGGTYRLRGFYEGRYRDRWMVLSQLEYRAPIYWRLGAVAFVGGGDVGRLAGDLFSSGPKFSGGAGLRLMVDREGRTNVSFDYGVSRDQSGLYVNVGEVF